MKKLFRYLTGDDRHILRDFQEVVSSQILEGRNVLLSAPTGAGKTWAALLPFLYSFRNGSPVADRLIYVLPLRSLATSLYQEAVRSCRRVFDVQTLPRLRNGSENEIVITIQTGESRDDPFFEGDIIFTTVDQCLSSYIHMPVSLPKRLGNINAGALLGSLIVLDEFHLLEPDKAMQTAIEMLSRLKPFSRFLIMTATLSARTMEELAGLLQGEVVRVPEAELKVIPSHVDKQRTFRWIDHALEAEDVIRVHRGGRSIVIVNTVRKAQEIYDDLRDYASHEGVKLFLLHSRFYPEDRKETEEQLNDWFGKDASSTNGILVTTQVIEAGIDISGDNLHTELAPMNSIIQRAGRCARYPGERGIGTVWVYELEADDEGRTRLGPYRGLSQVVDETRKAMESLGPSGKIIDFCLEQEWIDRVHTQQELRHLNSYRQNIHQVKKGIHEAMDGLDPAAVRRLIRDVSSINVVVTDRPEDLRFDRAEWPQMISVPRSSLYRLKEHFSGIIDESWVAKVPMEGDDDYGALQFEWQAISDIKEAVNASWMLAVHPNYASYSADLGLQIGVSGSCSIPKYRQRPFIPRYSMRYETYGEHLRRVLEACRAMHRSYRKALKVVEDYYADVLKGRGIEELAELACILHDTGKLSIRWQEAIRSWQTHKDPSKMTGEPIAHSDYDPEVDFEDQRRFPRRPHHAAEGAYAVAGWLRETLDEDLAVTIWTAITRHHGAFTDSLGEFRLINGAVQWVKDSLANDAWKSIILADSPPLHVRKGYRDDLLSFSKGDEKCWALYVFLVRRLRLADQRSQEGG